VDQQPTDRDHDQHTTTNRAFNPSPRNSRNFLFSSSSTTSSTMPITNNVDALEGFLFRLASEREQRVKDNWDSMQKVCFHFLSFLDDLTDGYCSYSYS
jgi:hypothetical protein